MKTEQDLLESRRGRLNQVIRNSIKLHEISNLEWCATDKKVAKHPSAERIKKMRDIAQDILQAVHEYSAYSTAVGDIEA